MKHTCYKCGKVTKVVKATLPDGIPFEYHKCRCGEGVLDMEQLHVAAEHYRKLKKHNAKLSRWGQSLGLRIPKELTEKYKLGPKSVVQIIEEEDGLKLII